MAMRLATLTTGILLVASVTGTVLFPLNDNGIKPAVTPVIGFERAF